MAVAWNRKSLIERHASRDDRRGMIVRTTERGKSNYALVRQEWASAVSAACGVPILHHGG